MSIAKVRKGDLVEVLAGRDKGRQGTVLSVKDNRVTVEGLNMVSKCYKPQPQADEEGGIRRQPSPMHVSNVALVNTATGKACRVGIKQLEDGSRLRIDKRTGDVLD